MPPTSVSVSVNSAGPVPFGLLNRLKVTVPVGLEPPETVALSATELPTVAPAGCCEVVRVGAARMLIVVVVVLTPDGLPGVPSLTCQVKVRDASRPELVGLLPVTLNVTRASAFS